MYMAPDSWKGLWKSTLKHVKSGTIPMSRLDDAVRRILRVKIASGIFTKGAPSTRPNAGDEKQLALPANRAIARQAVRESMVLLKNNQGLLPLDASKTILVVGKGADSISKICGGWTLSWQGTGHSNKEFPNSETILAGIKAAATQAGGKVIYSENGDTNIKADVVIAVYGEDPYAEFQGDRENLDFTPNDFDVSKLAAYKKKGIPVVSVFLSGRPLWTNPEINQSDAFVATWLPGSEGGGISDMLFQRDASYDFKGRLSFSWPNTAVVSKSVQPLFELGYGLTYKNTETLKVLSEDSGIKTEAIASTGEFFNKGAAVDPWTLEFNTDNLSKKIASFPTSLGGLVISKTDHQAQEDALRLKWTKSDSEQLRISSSKAVNMARQTNGAMELVFSAKSFSDQATTVQLGMCSEGTACEQTLDINIAKGDWKEYRISLSCFANIGVVMTKITSALILSADKNVDIGISNIYLGSDLDAKPGCDGN